MQENPHRKGSLSDSQAQTPHGAEPVGALAQDSALPSIERLTELFRVALNRYNESDPRAMNTFLREYEVFIRSKGIDPNDAPIAVSKLRKVFESAGDTNAEVPTGRERGGEKTTGSRRPHNDLLEKTLREARRSAALAAKQDSFARFAEVVKEFRPALLDVLQVARAEKGAETGNTYPLKHFDGLYFEQVVHPKKSEEAPCLEALLVMNLKVPVVLHLRADLNKDGDKMARGALPLLTVLTTQGNLVATYEINPKKIDSEKKDGLLKALQQSIAREEEEPFSQAELKTFLVRLGWKSDLSGLLFPETPEGHPPGFTVNRKGKGEPWAIPGWGSHKSAT